MVEKALDEIKRGAVEIIDSDKIRDLVEKFIVMVVDLE